MQRQIPLSRRSELFFWGIAAAVSAHFSLAYTWLLTRAFDYRDYSYGQVDYPYRTRRLMSFVFRWVLTAAQRMHFNPRPGAYFDLFGETTLLVVMISMLVAIWATRNSIQVLLGKNTAWVWAAFLVPYMAYFHFLLIAEIRVQTPYDVPSMAFYALALYAILARRRAMFYLIFVVATVNRETTLFLPFFFLIRQLDDDRPLVEGLRNVGWPRLGELAAQLAIWGAIHTWAESSVAKGNHLWRSSMHQNFHFLLNPLHWPTMASVFGFLWIPYLVFFREIPNAYLRRCSILFAPWFVMMVLYGDLLEIRIHSEWISYLAICLALIGSLRATAESVCISTTAEPVA
jgi:hypothetical protein